MSIKAILYCKFDTQEGPKIVHQVPENSILTTSTSAISAVSPEHVNVSSSFISSSNTTALLSFSTISRFLIPRQSLCGNLITLSPPPLTPGSPACLVISYPICLKGSHYLRNEFIFNFAFVLSPPDAVDVPAYKSVVTKLAHLMRSLEEQSHFLSDDAPPPPPISVPPSVTTTTSTASGLAPVTSSGSGTGGSTGLSPGPGNSGGSGGSGKIYSLCEMILEDLNNYAECMIPIDEINTLNIKLFPTLPNPAPVKAWHVPLFTVRIESLMDENWDLTMQRVIPYIDGINSVKKIAHFADADLKLTIKCIRHLLYYGCVLLLDVFSFNAIYAPTAEFTSMIASDAEMQAECARYVNTAFEPARQAHGGGAANELALTSSLGPDTAAGSVRSTFPIGAAASIPNHYNYSYNNGNGNGNSGAGADRNGDGSVTSSSYEIEEFWPLTGKGEVVDGVGIVQLFAAMKQGLSVRDWYRQNSNMLANVDLRRFATFGVIRGFLYRVHRYAIQTSKIKPSGRTSPHAAAARKQQPHPHPHLRPHTKPRAGSRPPSHSGSGSDSRRPRQQGKRKQGRYDYDDGRDDGRLRGRDIYGLSDSSSREDEDDFSESERDDEEHDRKMDARISTFLDGTHCFDEICTELGIGEKELERRLGRKEMGEVVVICR